MNQILGQIRQEYDEIAVKNRDEAEQWYKVRDFLPDFMAFSLSKSWTFPTTRVFCCQKTI